MDSHGEQIHFLDLMCKTIRKRIPDIILRIFIYLLIFVIGIFISDKICINTTILTIHIMLYEYFKIRYNFVL